MKKIVFTVFTLFAVNAGAASLYLSGGGDGVVGSSNVLPADWYDFNGMALAPNVGDDITVFGAADLADGDGVYMSEDTAALRFEYLGKEAGNINTAFSGVSGMFDTANSSVGDVVYQQIDGAGGAVEFIYATDGRYTGGVAGALGNALGATDADLSMAVIVESATSMILLFGDGLGDADWDDMMVRVSAVPVPAAVWLFGSVLAGVFGLRIRKKA